jgi:SAM-dependent methyltransferase
MAQILDGLRQLKRSWNAFSTQKGTGAADGSHSATLDRILREPIGRRSPHQVFGGTTDDFWLWCFTEGYRQDQRLRAVLPSFPPEEIQYRFAGSAGDATMRDAFGFYRIVKNVAAQHRPQPLESVLEFGCGWGRIIRWFLHDIEPDRLWGIDCLPEAIELCRTTNPYCRFEQVNPFPPSTVPSEAFDLIYSYSVFSHLSEEAHLAWLTEFKRMLKPGGLLIATTRPREFIFTCAKVRAARDERDWAQGTMLAFKDTDDALARFDRGEYLYEGIGGGGVLDASFFGETCIPAKYVRDNWTKLFEFIEFVDDRQMCDQNIIIVRKTS